MAKEIKVIHINDGSEKMLTNGNFHFAEEYGWTGEVISLENDIKNAGIGVTVWKWQAIQIWPRSAIYSK